LLKVDAVHSNWWLSILSLLEAAAPAVALAILLVRRLAPLWPSLTAALAFEVLVDVSLYVLLHVPHHYATYFYLFWIASGVQAILRLWITADIVRAIPGIGFFPRTAYLFVGVLGVVMAVAAAAYTWQDPVSIKEHVVFSILLLNRAVNIAWVAFFLTMLALLKLLRIGWNPLGACVTTGVVLRICASAVAAEMYTRPSHSIRLVANTLESIGTILVLGFWAYAFSAASSYTAEDLPVEEDSDDVRFTLRLLEQALPQRER
jgi:hypothetical protein